ncbi:M20 family metallopeptidase [Gluconobacter kanchanaburiensis]|uniref:Probable succinyl-diaminopimelate desuccinylase n=1 Tax=Gluconobacter kanchanaburiensis NBRC 103587 TaxID=1307948 RepID=A0A511B9U5_9PROT|nr:ArgE/DapE family deacylase [Gluconobacter kanchanaburiensis]MBF0862397.1 ArgE/DapE family deacylase [Gluconobacter kanchanaburiensis]GEK96482.1 acetylornithine deacetylase [Gluconobacter kanchanaburiensis NBRC 103587]
MKQAFEKICALIDAEQDWAIRQSQAIVRIPSVNPKFQLGEGLNREADVQAHLAGLLEEMGLGTHRYDVFPGRPNLIASLPGEDERSLMLNGHIDVVPAGEAAAWSMPPFSGELADGCLWGRGATDMKSGVIAMIAALRAILRAGYRPCGRVDIHSVVDEEAGGFGAIHAAANFPKCRAGIITETTYGRILPAEGGLEWVRVVIPGRAAHSAWRYTGLYPQADAPSRTPGVSAVDLGARFLMALGELERDWAMNKSHPLLPPGMNTLHAGVVRAGAFAGPDGVPTMMENPAITPDCCAIDIDLKFLPNEKSADVRAEFEAFVNRFAGNYVWLKENPPQVIWELGGLHFEPMNTPVEHPLVQSLVSGRKALGLKADIAGFIAVSDAAHYAAQGIPCAIYGCSGNNAHGIDEYVTLDSITETTKVLAYSIMTCCGIQGL